MVVGIQDDVDTDEDNDNDKKSMQFQASSVAKIKLPNDNFNSGAEHQFLKPVSKFTPYNETIINGFQSNYLKGVRGNDELETLNAFHAYNNRDADDDQYDSEPDFSQPPGYDSMPSWSLDVSVRRSPEGTVIE